MSDYTRQAEDLPPTLPVETMSARTYLKSIYEHGALGAQRVRFETHQPDEPDTIILDAALGRVSATICLTPAMIVHLANTMLTDNERAAIHVCEGLPS